MKYYVNACHKDNSGWDYHDEIDVFLIEIQDQSKNDIKSVLSRRLFHQQLIELIDEAIKNEKVEKIDEDGETHTKLIIKKCNDDEYKVLKEFMEVPELRI